MAKQEQQLFRVTDPNDPDNFIITDTPPPPPSASAPARPPERRRGRGRQQQRALTAQPAAPPARTAGRERSNDIDEHDRELADLDPTYAELNTVDYVQRHERDNDGEGTIYMMDGRVAVQAASMMNYATKKSMRFGPPQYLIDKRRKKGSGFTEDDYVVFLNAQELESVTRGLTQMVPLTPLQMKQKYAELNGGRGNGNAGQSHALMPYGSRGGQLETLPGFSQPTNPIEQLVQLVVLEATAKYLPGHTRQQDYPSPYGRPGELPGSRDPRAALPQGRGQGRPQARALPPGRRGSAGSRSRGGPRPPQDGSVFARVREIIIENKKISFPAIAIASFALASAFAGGPNELLDALSGSASSSAVEGGQQTLAQQRAENAKMLVLDNKQLGHLALHRLHVKTPDLSPMGTAVSYPKDGSHGAGWYPESSKAPGSSGFATGTDRDIMFYADAGASNALTTKLGDKNQTIVTIHPSNLNEAVTLPDYTDDNPVKREPKFTQTSQLLSLAKARRTSKSNSGAMTVTQAQAINNYLSPDGKAMTKTYKRDITLLDTATMVRQVDSDPTKKALVADWAVQALKSQIHKAYIVQKKSRPDLPEPEVRVAGKFPSHWVWEKFLNDQHLVEDNTVPNTLTLKKSTGDDMRLRINGPIMKADITEK